MRSHRLLPLVALLAVASSLPAQDLPAGTVTMHMNMKTPEGNPAAGMLGPSIDMQMTFATDGHRLGLAIVPNLGQGMMAGMNVKGNYTIGADTFHVGIMLPPAMAAAQGAPGMRFDVPLSMFGGMSNMLGSAMDSMRKKMADSLPMMTYRSLGTTAVVAGMTCENWEIVGMGDTTRTCVIPMPAAILAMKDKVSAMAGMKDMMAKIPGLADAEKQAYDGRKMLAIRTTTVKAGLLIELTSYTAGVADTTIFTLPADLKAMPMPGMPGMQAPKPAGGGLRE